ncbi:MAG TPA: hypothetical protein VMB85_20005 [Bryobacteraceae bacterium]|jgi:hypothetical protein|nr:hypothetical protein [Bryobacteraceae bacterium]
MIVRFLVAVMLAAAALAQSPAPLFSQVNEMVSDLSGITGWKVERRVPSQMLSKENFRKYVDSRMKDSASEEEIHAEEAILKMLGFVPQNFDLAKETVDLVSEQAAAYYDYTKKRLFILDSTQEGAEQRVALVHELAHALADQHHPLGKFLRKGSPDDDASTARQAVMEGQATWLTWAYMSEHNGGKAEVSPELIDELTKSVGADGADYPVFTNAPLYMKESLVFPYDEGLKFQDAIYHKMGRAAFDQVFNHAPESTQQILHPAAYLAGEKPVDPEPPALREFIGKKAAKQFRVEMEGSLGEFDFSVLLRQYIDAKDGADAASHWRGGSCRLYQNKRAKSYVLTDISEWDSPEAAHRFFDLYQRVMKGRWKKMEVEHRDPDKITGSGDDGRFQVWVTGTTVQSIEGMR